MKSLTLEEWRLMYGNKIKQKYGNEFEFYCIDDIVDNDYFLVSRNDGQYRASESNPVLKHLYDITPENLEKLSMCLGGEVRSLFYNCGYIYVNGGSMKVNIKGLDLLHNLGYDIRGWIGEGKAYLDWRGKIL